MSLRPSRHTTPGSSLMRQLLGLVGDIAVGRMRPMGSWGPDFGQSEDGDERPRWWRIGEDMPETGMVEPEVGCNNGDSGSCSTC